MDIHANGMAVERAEAKEDFMLCCPLRLGVVFQPCSLFTVTFICSDRIGLTLVRMSYGKW